jgi:hypothetical protein
MKILNGIACNLNWIELSGIIWIELNWIPINSIQFNNGIKIQFFLTNGMKIGEGNIESLFMSMMLKIHIYLKYINPKK